MATSSTPRPPAPRNPVLTVAATEGALTSRCQEIIVLELAGRRGQCLTTSQLGNRVRLTTSTVSRHCAQLADLGHVAQIGRTGKEFTWAATELGHALAELIREELAARPEPKVGPARLVPGNTTTATNPTGVAQFTPPVSVAAHPAGGRVAAEEAVWAWVRQVTRADLAGASHRLVEALHQALAEEGLA